MTITENFIEIVDELLNHHTDVHAEHAEALSKRLHDKHVKHTKKKKKHGHTTVYSFGYRPEYTPLFVGCCHDTQNASTSSTPVCVGPSSSGSATAGGGAETSTVGSGP